MLLALVVGITGCSNKNEQPMMKEQPTVEHKQVIEAFGIVKAARIRNIIVDFPAVVQEIHVKEGQEVKKGQELITLDLSQYETQVQNKRYELNIAQLELQRLNSELQTVLAQMESESDPQLQKRLNDLKNAEQLLQKIQEELSAKEILYQEGAISQHELEEFKKQIDAKEKAVTDAQFSLMSYKDGKQQEKVQLLSKIKIQEEKVESLKYDLKHMQELLNRSYFKDNQLIVDLEKGIVFEIGYAAGDHVTASKKVLSMMDLNRLVVEADVTEDFIKDVKVGSPVVIKLLADTSKKYNGKVIHISDMAVKRNGETIVPVEISIDNKDDFIMPNFNVDVEISK